MVVQNGSPFFYLKLLDKVVLVITLKGWSDFEQLLVAYFLVTIWCLKAVAVKDDALDLLSRGFFSTFFSILAKGKAKNRSAGLASLFFLIYRAGQTVSVWVSDPQAVPAAKSWVSHDLQDDVSHAPS